MQRIAVIGLGNPHRADDAVGILVVRALAGRAPADVVLVEGGDPLSILERWPQFDAVILVDAVLSGSPAGTVQVFDGRRLPYTARSSVVSSHGFCMRDVIGLGEALGVLSPVVRVVGIEAAEFTAGAPPMPEVERAVAAAVDVVLRELDAIGRE